MVRTRRAAARAAVNPDHSALLAAAAAADPEADALRSALRALRAERREHEEAQRMFEEEEEVRPDDVATGPVFVSPVAV